MSSQSLPLHMYITSASHCFVYHFKPLTRHSVSPGFRCKLSMLRILFPLVLVLLSLDDCLSSVGPVADLVISNVNVSPDGFSRSAISVGGMFPGPVISGKKGDRFRLNVHDQLTDNTMARTTSIHWHGIFQQTTNWADGAAFVSQCPIAPNNSFLYEFNVEQSGTYWYHSHLSTQYCDGLRGAIVIYDPDDPHGALYDVDDESTVITLADWYHLPSPAATPTLTRPFPYSNATLINGKGRYEGGPAVPLSVVNIESGKRYRFRIVSMACDPNFTFSIDNHQFTVIEADGEGVVPLLVDSLVISPGQRYSVVLNANQPVDNYWIRADPSRGIPGFAGGINSAVLRYSGAPASEPLTVQLPSIMPLLETALVPSTSPAAPGIPAQGQADVVINIAHDFDFDSFHYRMNGYPWIPPKVPVLLQILSGARTAQELLPKGSLYSLPRNKVIELSLPGTGPELGGPHPFHLHGHSFSVVRSAGSKIYNYATPVRRDTVSTGVDGDNVTIRFVTDNAGPWFLHCHIDWHLELGLAVVFAEDIPDTPALDPVPAAWEQLCPIYDQLPSDEQ